MGTSTDAILALGFDLGEELPEKLFILDEERAERADYFEFDTWFKQNVFEEPEPDIEKDGDAWSAWYKRSNAALEEYPLNIIQHCSSDYPMWFLTFRGTIERAKRGNPVAIEYDFLNQQIPDDKLNFLKEFCDEFGIEWQEPKWHIFSMWG